MTIHADHGAELPRFEQTLADALAAWCDLSFEPLGRRKAVARHFDLTTDEARTVLEARASRSVIDRILKHKNGGWRVAIPVLGSVIGQTADNYIMTEKKRLENERKKYEAREARLAAIADDLRSVGPVSLGEPLRRRAVRQGMGAGPDQGTAGAEMIHLGDILYGLHVAYQAVTRPIRERRPDPSSEWLQGVQRFHKANPADDRKRGEIAKDNRVLLIEALRAESKRSMAR
ncbi:hypothetical protein LTR94_023418 [Friedmanniomyces endolithicus]|nr:hypothetical protein LTR94_023418 [Friedmanniomyces endolithicus]